MTSLRTGTVVVLLATATLSVVEALPLDRTFAILRRHGAITP
jgi:hypothetical protein